MAKSRLGKEIWIETKDETGKLAKVCGPLAEKRLNLSGLCAWAEEGKATILLIAEDDSKVSETLKAAGFSNTVKEVLLVDCDNKPGGIFEIAQKLEKNNIGIHACYATASGGKSLIVLATDDNKKAAGILG